MVVDGVNVNAKDRQGQTALYAAIEARDKETYLLLLGKGANPNLCDHVGMSPIHLAAEQDDIFWLREALQHGGNPNELNTGNTFYPNETPIFYAISNGAK